MDPERFQRLSAAFALALERPPSGRDGYLEGQLGDDPDLLARARAMLAAHDTEDDFLTPPSEETLASRVGAAGPALEAGPGLRL